MAMAENAFATATSTVNGVVSLLTNACVGWLASEASLSSCSGKSVGWKGVSDRIIVRFRHFRPKQLT